jgi:hypothetical protein
MDGLTQLDDATDVSTPRALDDDRSCDRRELDKPDAGRPAAAAS